MAGLFSQVFQRDNHRCVYCGKYMLHDFETFYTSQLDHLVPGAGNQLDNVVLSCYVCNSLKGKHVPPMEYSLDARAIYNHAVRSHVMGRRAERMQDFASWTHPTEGQPIKVSE